MRIEFTNKEGQVELFDFSFAYIDGALVDGEIITKQERLEEKKKSGALKIKECHRRRICKCIITKTTSTGTEREREEITSACSILHPWDVNLKCVGRKLAFERALKNLWCMYMDGHFESLNGFPVSWKRFARILWRMYLINTKFPGKRKPMSLFNAEKFIGWDNNIRTELEQLETSNEPE